MQQILFLRDFTASRVIKGRFTLRSRSPGPAPSLGSSGCAGAEERPEERFAFDHRPHHFASGETARVRHILRRHAGNLLVISDNPVLGEVVLDGAREGQDYKVIG